MGATFEEAKKAYRDLVSVWHPDRISTKNPRLQKKAVERLKDINSAYQLLSSYYKSAGKMPYPPQADENKDFYEEFDSPRPDVAPRPWRRIAVLLSLFLAAIAGAGFYYYHQLQQINMGHRVAKEMLELSEAHVRELITNLAVGTSTETAPPEEAPAAAEPPHPPPVIKSVVSEAEKKQTDGIPSGSGGEVSKSTDSLAAIDKLIHQAESLIEAGRYPEARAAYDSALALVSKTGDLPTADRHARKTIIEIGLARDEIKYGAQGYVFYRNRWVSPDVYREEFVTYRGQPRHFKEMIGPLSQAVDPEVKASLLRRYSGQTIHKKIIRCLDVELIQNYSSSTIFRALCQWEVWTFDGQAKGRLYVVATYLPESDRWRIGKITDQ